MLHEPKRGHLKKKYFIDRENILLLYFTGKVSELDAHFDATHPNNKRLVPATELIINLSAQKRNECVSHLIKMGTYHFLCHFKISEQDELIYMTVQLLGSAAEAAKWTYELHLYNKKEPRRKFFYSNTCNSRRDTIDVVFNNYDCAIIPMAYAKTMNNGGIVNYKFYIKKSVESGGNEQGKQESEGGIRKQTRNKRYGRSRTRSEAGTSTDN